MLETGMGATSSPRQKLHATAVLREFWFFLGLLSLWSESRCLFFPLWSVLESSISSSGCDSLAISEIGLGEWVVGEPPDPTERVAPNHVCKA
jgi:hypothetical protein